LSKRIFALLFVIALVFGLYNNRNAIFLNRNVNRGGENIIHRVDGSLQRNFSIYRNLLLINSSQEITAINRNGRIMWSVPFAARNPFLEVNGSYILVADRGGSDVLVLRGERILSQFTIEGEIFTASINRNGFVSLATTADGFKTRIETYAPSGRKLYTWELSDSYLLDVAVSSNNRNLAVALFQTESERILGCLAFVEKDSERIIERPSFVNAIISAIHYNSNDHLLAIADTAALYYNRDGQMVWNHNFEGRTLQSYAFRPGGNLFLFFRNSRNTSTMEVIDMNGRVVGNAELHFEVRNVSVNRNTVVAMGTRDINVFNHRGKRRAELELNIDARWQGLMPNRRDIYVIHGNSIEVIRP
jgi:hypothetical protein